MTSRLVACRLLSLAALAISAALLVDHFRTRPALCPFKTTCKEVTRSAFGSPLGVPLPALGAAAFGTFFVLSLFPGAKASRFLGPLALTVGLTGLALAGIQFFILQQTCSLCLAVDVAAGLIALVGLGWPRPWQAPPPRPWGRLAWAGLAISAVAIPVLGTFLFRPREAPAQIRALWLPHQINVVEITDFTCPHCRLTHRSLQQVLQERGEAIHLVRLVVPLDYHKNARPAARAYLFAERQGKGKQMAEALFAASDLAPAALRQLAGQIGLNLKDYDAAVTHPALDREIDRTARWVKETHAGGLPDVWVQDQLLTGVQTPARLRAALDRVKTLEVP